jgi:hypothetical protein
VGGTEGGSTTGGPGFSTILNQEWDELGIQASMLHRVRKVASTERLPNSFHNRQTRAGIFWLMLGFVDPDGTDLPSQPG